MRDRKRRLLSGLLILLMTVMMSLMAMSVSAEEASTANIPANGWQKVGNASYYYKNGVAQKGRLKIGKKWYFFQSSGAMAIKDTTENGVIYYLNKYNNLEAFKKGKSYYKPSGKKMSKAAQDDYTTLRRARSVVKKITKKKMTKKQKLEKCFRYVMKFPYRQYRSFPARNKAWAALYANDHFVRRGGDCHSDAAAFAYLARALGYKNVHVCLDAKLSHNGHHAWTYVNGRYYDPLFAQAKSYSRYWSAKSYPLATIVKKKVAVGYVGDK